MLAKVIQDQIYGLDVNEYPDCDYCGSRNNETVLITPRLFKVVECKSCKLWFNSPRINEKQWLDWNFNLDNVVNKNFVINRLLYGVMFDSNIKYSHNLWRQRRRSLESSIMDTFEELLNRRLKRIHDVGTGVGFSLAEARRRGVAATGNEINAFAHKVMTEIFEFDVTLGYLGQSKLEDSSLDAMIMRDYIEHSYHPKRDLEIAIQLLKPGGILFLETFNIHCDEFVEHGVDWSFMGAWDHVYYFSKWAISRMVRDIGFKLSRIDGGPDKPLIKMYLTKPGEMIIV